MRSNLCKRSLAVIGSLAILLMTVAAAPLQDTEEEPSENMLAGRGDGRDADVDWDSVDTAAIRKLLLQLDADDRLGLVGGRVSRTWPQPEPRGWSLRQLRPLSRQWRADKRQVRFRQCYFNPISCFRK